MSWFAPASLWAADENASVYSGGGKLPVHVPSEVLVSSSAAKIQVRVFGVEDELLENIVGFLEILRFDGKPAPSRARVAHMHRAAEQQITKALEPFGYFHAEVASDLTLKDNLYRIQYTVTPGAQVVLKGLEIQVSGAGKNDPAFKKAIADTPLKVGKPLNQMAYEELKKRFQVLASERGYFDAVLQEQEIRVDLPSNAATMKLHFETGERYKLGEVFFVQPTEWISESLLNRFVEIEPGQWYESADLQRLQGDLSNTDYYKSVELYASPQGAEDFVIPVMVALTPRNPRKYILGVGYGTDTGARVTAGMTGRRVNSLGHHYNAEILIAQIKYGIAGEYVFPTGDPRTDSYGLRASIEEEFSDVRQYKALNLGGYYKYRDSLWIKTYALDYRVEEFKVSGETPVSQLLFPSVNWTRTFPAPLEQRIHPKNGTWLRLYLRGGSDALLSDTNFVQSLVAAKWIHGLGNGSRIIARGAIGATWIDDFDALPISLRYFAGGDKSVRGYGFSVISPLDDEREKVGGRHLTEASIEYEHPIIDKWSVAAFMDIGDAYDDEPDLHAGVGVGVRWVSPIGPVRIDFGSGLERPPGRNFRVHLTIGPDL